MISVKFLWDRLGAYGQKYQAGTDVVAYFNSALAEVQSEIFNGLEPIYDQSEKIKDLLNFWVKQQAGTSSPDGSQAIGTNPEVVCRPLSIGYTSAGTIIYSISEISESELIASARVPQRAPNVAKKIVYYRFNTPGTLNFYPAASIPYFCYYLIYPTAASIAFTYSSTSDEDIMTYDAGSSVQLAWPASATNLILYSMLDKYGVSVREQLLQSYAEYGIVKSASAGEVPKT